MTRRGLTVLEALLAMLVMSVIGSLWMRALVAQERHVRQARRVEQGRVAADEVMRVLTAAVHQSAADDAIQLHGDTGIALPAPVGVALSCAQFADSVYVPADSGAGARWEAAPDSGDIAVIESVRGVRSLHGVVRVAHRTAGTAGCAGSAWRVQISPSVIDAHAPLAVRVVRPVRLVVYRGSDGAWWWGERRCTSLAWSPCGPAQPIAGPLAAPRGGLLLSRDGARVMAALRLGTSVRRAAITRVP